ncbi:hypothetical protein HMPREF1322_1336 [Porphyromonas gingivalis W50]|nr:hypothetical protein HMPREF1322_1336 [Porphyromonas gingivalis W50]
MLLSARFIGMSLNDNCIVCGLWCVLAIRISSNGHTTIAGIGYLS